jgi:ribonuclease PH
MARSDGRRPDELRRIRFTRHYLKRAHGSVLFEMGDTIVLCAATIADGVPQWRRKDLPGQGWVTAEYSLLPASTVRFGTKSDRARREAKIGGQSGRTHEIQRLIGRSLRGVVDLAGLGGEYTITVDCDVIQADGGTRTAAITGGFIALHEALSGWRDAGRIATLPIVDRVAATSVGMVDGVPMLDLDYSEDSVAETDMNVVMDGHGRFVEVQGTAESAAFDRARLDQLLDLATGGIATLLGVQERATEEGLDAWSS